eukprot:343186-Pyramimonas_sp.AAC.1
MDNFDTKPLDRKPDMHGQPPPLCGLTSTCLKRRVVLRALHRQVQVAQAPSPDPCRSAGSRHGHQRVLVVQLRGVGDAKRCLQGHRHRRDELVIALILRALLVEPVKAAVAELDQLRLTFFAQLDEVVERLREEAVAIGNLVRATAVSRARPGARRLE